MFFPIIELIKLIVKIQFVVPNNMSIFGTYVRKLINIKQSIKLPLVQWEIMIFDYRKEKTILQDRRQI